MDHYGLIWTLVHTVQPYSHKALYYTYGLYGLFF